MSFFSAKKEKTTGLSSVVIQITGRNYDVFLRRFSLCIKQANCLTSSDMCVSARYPHSRHTCQTTGFFSYCAQFIRKEKSILSGSSFWGAKDQRMMMATLQGGFYSSLQQVPFPSLEFNYCKRAQVQPASAAQQCWMLFSSKSRATGFVLPVLTIVVSD